jgi:hypothetical protein
LKRLTCIALVVALALLGCGSSGKKASTKASDATDTASESDATDATDATDSTDTASDNRNQQQLEADRKIAQGALLKLSDLPEGFTASPRKSTSPDSPEEKAVATDFANCVGVDPSIIDDETDDTKAEAKSDKFKRAPSLDFEMSASVSASTAEQQKIFNAFKSSKAGKCFEKFFNDALTLSLEHPAPGETAPPGLTLGEASVETIDLGLHGKTVVYRATIPFTVQGQSAEVVSDFVLALKDRIGMTMTFQNVGEPFPKDLEVQIANEAIDGAPDS